MQKHFSWSRLVFKTSRFPPTEVKSHWCGCVTAPSMLPWEWSYPGEYFWYRSLPADICGLCSLSRQTLLNSDLQNQAEGERMTRGELCFLSGDWSQVSTLTVSVCKTTAGGTWEKHQGNWTMLTHFITCFWFNHKLVIFYNFNTLREKLLSSLTSTRRGLTCSVNNYLQTAKARTHDIMSQPAGSEGHLFATGSHGYLHNYGWLLL